MSESIFIASKQNIQREIVKINIRFTPSSIEALSHFFFIQRSRNSKKLYYAEIASIIEIPFEENLEEMLSEQLCIIEFNNGIFIFHFKNSIHQEPINILENVYAKSNSEMMGDRFFSIYHTMHSSNFSFSLPVIDASEFNLEETEATQEHNIRESLLYDNSIIPDVSEDKKIYARIVKEDEVFSLTLTNKKMLNFDYEYLFEEKHKEVYRPYFYEFSLSESSQQRIAYGDYDEDKLYEINLISLRNIQAKNPEELLEGVLLFSASPIKQIPAYVEIKGENKEESVSKKSDLIRDFFKQTHYTIQDKKKIEDGFMQKISLSNQHNLTYEVEIFNVGQGNWIHINIFDKKKFISRLVFDIGIGNGKGGHSDKKLRSLITMNAANDIDEKSTFVLSHWDSDHIQGVVELQTKQFFTTWIVPALPDKPKNGALRLAAFLKVDSNIEDYFIDHRLNGQLIFDNSYIKLGKGQGHGPSTKVSYTKENNSGLILAIKKANKQMLFPGDCEYIELPACFTHQEYEALIVSHHGASIKQSSLNSLGFISPSTKKNAVVCVGKNTSYPKECHKDSIVNLGYELHETRDYKTANQPCLLKL
ncbi:hypothetical protein LCM20_12275 [Halobacillus litoralis]|uniref:hypothetical protein n=1 Tax=Halobacillus litoralis TaxID=45668 RepID=UPI001CD72F75|nr:hypothetical protein [Halobacillus litoralis]MCA0971373.1 hypothetical protein [Halobacillus litoralis]